MQSPCTLEFGVSVAWFQSGRDTSELIIDSRNKYFPHSSDSHYDAILVFLIWVVWNLEYHGLKMCILVGSVLVGEMRLF